MIAFTTSSTLKVLVKNLSSKPPPKTSLQCPSYKELTIATELEQETLVPQVCGLMKLAKTNAQHQTRPSHPLLSVKTTMRSLSDGLIA
jgi:hypothetical protein